jgi:hypothetical protein
VIRLKEGVQPNGLSPQIVLAMNVAEGVYEGFGTKEVWVTSLGEQTPHSGRLSASLHWIGHAVDFRTHNLLSGVDPNAVARKISRCLGRDYDVLLRKESQPGEHIHCEYQPKR